MVAALVTSAALLAFSPMAPMAANSMASRSNVQMSETRRAFVGTFAAAVASAPLAAMADGASSPAVRGALPLSSCLSGIYSSLPWILCGLA